MKKDNAKPTISKQEKTAGKSPYIPRNAQQSQPVSNATKKASISSNDSSKVNQDLLWNNMYKKRKGIK